MPSVCRCLQRSEVSYQTPLVLESQVGMRCPVWCVCTLPMELSLQPTNDKKLKLTTAWKDKMQR